MEFVLRIFFSGLITFIPSTDGKELTVLLINAPHQYTMADGSALAHHKPFLLARAAKCEGTCLTDDHPAIASFMFATKPQHQAITALDGALLGGAAWQLASSELSFGGTFGPLAIHTGVRGTNADGTPRPVPTNSCEREDFAWVPDMSELAPATQGFRSALTADGNPGELVAARLRLRSGTIKTYSVVKIDGKARPIHFRKPSGTGPEAPYAQALANWVEARIHVRGESLEIIDQSFSDTTRRRSMKLYPQGDFVELALVNFPPFEAPPADAPAPSPQPGQHFQVFYELVKTPPAQADRLVPHQALSPSASDPQVDWASIHPRALMWSDLLEQLGLNPRGTKTPYELAICPPIRD